MITKKTVFILGAGTSIPYGYPSGRELLEVIVYNLRFQRWGFLTNLGLDIEQINEFGVSLEKSSLPSVDFFLEKQPDFINLGKVSIATIIMSLEDPKKLYNFKLREKGIYHYLYNQMVSGCKEISEFGNNKISFITFNYDRSLESFLFMSLKNSFGISGDEMIKNVIENIPIIHVYGHIGSLPWQSIKGRPYSSIKNSKRIGNESADEIGRASKKIIVLSEGKEDTHEFSLARDVLREAERVYFLGFGFHQENLSRMGLINLKLSDRNLKEHIRSPNYKKLEAFRGSSLGLRTAEREKIEKKWKIFLPNNTLDALEFLREYANFD